MSYKFSELSRSDRVTLVNINTKSDTDPFKLSLKDNSYVLTNRLGEVLGVGSYDYLIDRFNLVYIESTFKEVERLRRILLVSSYCYYERDESIITDSQWDRLAVRLEELQTSDVSLLDDDISLSFEFKDFTASSGYYLNFRLGWVISTGERLLAYQTRRLELLKQLQED